MLHFNWLHPVASTSTFTVALALVGACTLAPREDGSGSSGGDTGGSTIGQSTTSASDPGSASDPTSPLDTTTGVDQATGGDLPSTSSAPGEQTTGVITTLFTTGDESDTEEPTFDVPCGGGTVEQFNNGEWDAAMANYDDSEVVAAFCTTPPSPSDLPIPGLVQALVIRNDALAQPKDFVTANTRWMVWSNVELGCTDPFAAQLCEGQWRVSVPLAVPFWCELRVEETGTGGIGITFGAGYPFWMEVGDANCETQIFDIGPDDGFITVEFKGMGDKLPGDPQPGELRAECAVPGIDTLLIGTFTAEICPG